MNALERASEFLWGHARLLERRVFAARFLDGSPDAVATALRAYVNDDGGFGNALEPDLRAPASQPMCVEIGLLALVQAGTGPRDLAHRACGFLETVADAHGAVPPALPGAEAFPCANHWRDFPQWSLTPGVNPTAGIAGLLFALGVEHAWRDRAAAWCLEQIATETFASGHTLRSALTLLEHLPDRERAAPLLDRIRDQLAVADWFTAEVPVTTYTLTPLHFAPTPDAPARAWFDDAVIDAHLDDLVSNQQADGGWPIHWEAPGPGAVAEWRGRWTLDALSTLRAYGRV